MTQEPDSAESNGDENRPCALVVEDNLRLARLCIEYLKRLGYSATKPAPSTKAALELIETEQIHLGLLDLSVTDGLVFPVAEELHRRQIPFIFCTGFDEYDLIPQGMRDSPRLTKPFTEEDLRGAIDSLF